MAGHLSIVIALGYSSMNARQKRHNRRENERIWQRSLTTIAILKYLYSTFFSFFFLVKALNLQHYVKTRKI